MSERGFSVVVSEETTAGTRERVVVVGGSTATNSEWRGPIPLVIRRDDLIYWTSPWRDLLGPLS